LVYLKHTIKYDDLISKDENTYAHIKDKIKSKKIGPLTFKGKSKPIDVYMVGENKTSKTSSGGRKTKTKAKTKTKTKTKINKK